MRVLRVMRMVTMVPSMRRVVGALLSAIPGLGSIAMVLALVPVATGAMAQASGSYTASLWLTAGVLTVGMAIMLRLRALESRASS